MILLHIMSSDSVVKECLLYNPANCCITCMANRNSSSEVGGGRVVRRCWVSSSAGASYNFDYSRAGGGQVGRWCWVNFQCLGVLQYGFQ